MKESSRGKDGETETESLRDGWVGGAVGVGASWTVRVKRVCVVGMNAHVQNGGARAARCVEEKGVLKKMK